jgi:hypothetical protein
MLVPNAPQVLARASSLWAAYGAIVLYFGDKVVEYLQSQDAANLTWKDGVLGVLLVAIPILRIWYQESIATATEQKLAAEKLTRQRLELVATSEGPAISQDEVKAIKRDSAAAVKE